MREFRKSTNRNSRPQVWFIGINESDKKTYITQWGVLNGALQETKNSPGSCGDPNHINYQSPEQYAQFCMNREIRLKIEQGYVEVINGEVIGQAVNNVDFNNSLPKNLCFYKPKKEISDKLLNNLFNRNLIIHTLKRDGMMHIAIKTHEWDIYSRRMDLVNDQFPHIIDKLNSLEIPNNSILLGEMCIINNGIDDFKAVSKVCRSKADLALAYQGFVEFPKRKKGELVIGPVRYYVYDIAFWGGRDLISGLTIEGRLEYITNLFNQLNKNIKIKTGIGNTLEEMKAENKIRDEILLNHNVGPLKIFKLNINEDLEFARKQKIEGFVLHDISSLYGDKAYSFDGKSQRPEGIWKRKPSNEQEAFVSGIYEGTGENMGRTGGVVLQQVHPISSDIINCGKCGCGFTDDERILYWNNKDLIVGKSIKILFDSRQKERNGSFSFRFPVYNGIADKEKGECFAEDLNEDEQ